jgi:hypothetical protein
VAFDLKMFQQTFGSNVIDLQTLEWAIRRMWGSGGGGGGGGGRSNRARKSSRVAAANALAFRP